jgi:hypothetical protein
VKLTAAEIFGPDEQHERRVTIALENERAKRDARRLLEAEDRGDVTIPAFETLRARLARPATPTRWRIDRWQPEGTRVLLAAQFKAGKTTFVGNVLRSLLDGGLFLGHDRVEPVSGAVVLLDFEMSEKQLTDWLRAQRITADDRAVVVSLRGRAATFNVLDAEVRADWVKRLKVHAASYLMIDCVRPILDALGLDEQRDAGRFLVAVDALMAEANVPEGMVVHHMGHTGERSRGDSRLRDWPDVEWRLVRAKEEGKEDPAAPRYITAYGRDVDVPEVALAYEPNTRQLTIIDGNRQDAKTRAAVDDVLAAVDASPEPLSRRAIERACHEAGSAAGRDTIRAAVSSALKSGMLIAEHGPRHATLHRRASQCASARVVREQCADTLPAQSPDAVRECAAAPIGAAHRSLKAATPLSPMGISPEAWSARHQRQDNRGMA